MSQKKHFFYYGRSADERGRRLPDERDELPAAARVRATALLAYTEEETDYAVMAEALLDEMVSKSARLLSKQSPTSLSSLYLLFGDFCRRYDGITVLPPKDGCLPVAPVTHGLYFAMATAVHYAVSVSSPLVLAMEEGAPAITLTSPLPSEDEKTAPAVLGLDREERLEILHHLGEASGFSVSLHPGKETSLRFEMPQRPLGTVRLRAISDPSLEAAFLLPLSVFHY